MKKLCLAAFFLAGATIAQSVGAKEYYKGFNESAYSDDKGCHLFSTTTLEGTKHSSKFSVRSDGSFLVGFLTPNAPPIARGEAQMHSVHLAFLDAEGELIGGAEEYQAKLFAPSSGDRFLWTIHFDATQQAAVLRKLAKASIYGIIFGEDLVAVGRPDNAAKMVEQMRACTAEEGWRNP